MSDILEHDVSAAMTVTSTWDGSPLTLAVNDQAQMPQTPDGTLILAAIDLSPNSQGTLAVSSGSQPFPVPPLPAGATAPWVAANNFGANNLKATNVSSNQSVTIKIQAVGPGIPGVTPANLPQLSPTSLAPGAVAAGNTNPAQMQLQIQNPSGNSAVIGIVGGPQDDTGNNGYVIGLNFGQTAGPGTSNPSGKPQQGYYATTTGNSYTFSFNWNGGNIFVGNVSSSQASNVTLTLRSI
ncbi:MAG TPA: hypothetical protein VFT45_26225 [Longimicrobium sp.]|nr:hypothetical protein [Longimicrobium sp.]